MCRVIVFLAGSVVVIRSVVSILHVEFTAGAATGVGTALPTK